jgi:hypothetical protein
MKSKRVVTKDKPTHKVPSFLLLAAYFSVWIPLGRSNGIFNRKTKEKGTNKKRKK